MTKHTGAPRLGWGWLVALGPAAIVLVALSAGYYHLLVNRMDPWPWMSGLLLTLIVVNSALMAWMKRRRSPSTRG